VGGANPAGHDTSQDQSQTSQSQTGSNREQQHAPTRTRKPIGPARRRERARRRAKRRGEKLIEPKSAAFSHLERLLRHAARSIPTPQTIPHETRPQPLTSWRNPRAIHYQPTPKSYPLKFCRWARNLMVFLVLLLLASAAVLPSLAMHPASHALHQVRDSTAFVNFGAAEVQQAQREQLARLKTIPHDPAALAKQFEHGINSHLPDGVTHRVNIERYMTDEETQLIIDRVPGVTEEQFGQLLKMLREMAPKCVAYSLDDLSGYTGTEPPLRIVLNTTASIRRPPRRNWSQAESEVIDKKCQELLAGQHPVLHSTFRIRLRLQPNPGNQTCARWDVV
jgi:hypothetical protein